MDLYSTLGVLRRIGMIGTLALGLLLTMAGTASADPWGSEEQGGTAAGTAQEQAVEADHCASFDGMVYIGCPVAERARIGFALQETVAEVNHCAYYDGLVYIGCASAANARIAADLPGAHAEAEAAPAGGCEGSLRHDLTPVRLT